MNSHEQQRGSIPKLLAVTVPVPVVSSVIGAIAVGGSGAIVFGLVFGSLLAFGSTAFALWIGHHYGTLGRKHSAP